MKMYEFGKSPQALPVWAYEFGQGACHVLILGGVHGDETEGVIAAQGLLSHFLGGFPYAFRLTLVPAFNIDGVLAKSRGNSRGVDLNRNLPTKDWSPHVATPRYNPGPFAMSEPENLALATFIENENPQVILSLHSWHPVLNVNGACEPFAQRISEHTGYRVEGTIGYPTPGCLGTFAGLERKSPTLTYEIERGLGAPEILSIHVPAILEALKVYESH